VASLEKVRALIDQLVERGELRRPVATVLLALLDAGRYDRAVMVLRLQALLGRVSPEVADGLSAEIEQLRG
jgi:hypothetical protein